MWNRLEGSSPHHFEPFSSMQMGLKMSILFLLKRFFTEMYRASFPVYSSLTYKVLIWNSNGEKAFIISYHKKMKKKFTYLYILLYYCITTRSVNFLGCFQSWVRLTRSESHGYIGSFWCDGQHLYVEPRILHEPLASLKESIVYR